MVCVASRASVPETLAHLQELLDAAAQLLVEEGLDGADRPAELRHELDDTIHRLRMAADSVDALRARWPTPSPPPRQAVGPSTSLLDQEHIAGAFDDVPISVLRGCADRGVFAVNRRWSQVTHLSASASRGDGWLVGVDPRHRGAAERAIATVLATGEDAESECRLVGNGAGSVWVQVRVGRDAGTSDGGDGWVMALAELVHSSSDVAELTRRSLHDSLTGLANRELLEDRVRHALARRLVDPGSMALLFIDLDGFKAVNDSFGHAAGDVVLRSFAQGLTRCLRPLDTAARVGGDEFVVLCEELAGPHDVRAIIGRILAAAAAPLAVGNGLVGVRASIGVTFGVAGDTFPQLRDRADRAMFAVKERGGDGYAIG